MTRQDLENTNKQIGDKIAHRLSPEDEEKDVFGENARFSLELFHELDHPQTNRSLDVPRDAAVFSEDFGVQFLHVLLMNGTLLFHLFFELRLDRC